MKTELRKVSVNDYDSESKKFIDKGRTAIFHGFGVGCEGSDENFGNYSTAILEFPDGHVENVYVERIRFLPAARSSNEKN